MVKLCVLSPMAGTSHDVSDVPDPVFASGMVGPGLAIDPERRPQTAVAPIDGRLIKLHPHAYLIRSEQGPGVLVHLGIDTVRMHGDGFAVLATEEDEVVAGQDMVTWDPAYVLRTGHSPMCAVVVLDCPATTGLLQPAGTALHASQPIIDVDC